MVACWVLRGIVIKSHGSADKYSYEWAIQRAFDAVKNDVLKRISTSLAELMPAQEATQSILIKNSNRKRMTFQQIIGTGSFAIKRVTNHELADQSTRGNRTSDEWIVSRSGIFRLDTMLNLKGTPAISALRQQSVRWTQQKMQANDIDLIILATSTPDFFGGFPKYGVYRAAKLGITNGSAAVDVQAVCSGFIYAMAMATA